jgi:peptidoglycan L-alanyl-D-glutamate endopeptidase CwlK
MDKRTEKAIATLHPKIRQLVTDCVNKADVALSGRADMIIVQALRTFPEQDALYKKRPKVTNAKAGQSYHNYGLAIDFCLQIDGKDISWDTVKDFDGDKKSDWFEVIAVFETYGFKSGKSFNDLPHFEMTFGYNWRDLLKKYNAKDFIPGTVYVNI